MIDYLEQLVEEKKYREAVDLAEKLLKDADNPHDIVRIHVARVMSHCFLGEEQAALAGGEFAMGLAKEIGAWDDYGMMAQFVGVAYARLGQFSESISRMYDYLGNLHLYAKAKHYEYNAWYNVGNAQVALNQHQAAITSLSNALKAALRIGEQRYAHGVRQSLIDVYLRLGIHEPIPRLLAQCAHYLRHNDSFSRDKKSWAYHIKLHGEYALATSRIKRASLLAAKGLVGVEGIPKFEFLFHMVLAQAASTKGEPVEALEHALAARTCAVLSRRSDLEAEASDLVYRYAKDHPEALGAVDKHYKSGLI